MAKGEDEERKHEQASSCSSGGYAQGEEEEAIMRDKLSPEKGSCSSSLSMKKKKNKKSENEEVTSHRRKRQAEEDEEGKSRQCRGEGREGGEEEEEQLDFEDPFDDEFDEEDTHGLEAYGQGNSSEEEEDEEEEEMKEKDEESQEVNGEGSSSSSAKTKSVRAWRPGIDELSPDEELDYDSSAYEMLHRATMEWPCLSFDILTQLAGGAGEATACQAMVSCKPPYTAYVVGGTQAEKSSGNRLFVMKWSDLHKTNKDARDSDEDEDSDGDDDDDDSVEGSEEEPKFDFRIRAHQGTVNRLRCCPQMNRLVATWSDRGEVNVYDIQQQILRLDDPGAPGAPPSPHEPPKFQYKGHGVEGYAMDWNPVHTGRFLSGDVEGGVCLWEPCEGGWDVSEIMRSPVSRGGKKSTSSSSRNKPQSFSSSSSSLCRFEGVTPGSTVEETQWKIKGSGAGDVFATASSDGGIRIYDCRSSSRAPCLALLHAHASDVNALRWSPVHGDLLLSGDEDGCAKVWDERFGESPLVVMHWHKKPITSLDWHPTDEATFATSSLDNSIALWDMSVEIDQDETPAEQEDPAQKKKNAKGEEDDPKSKLPEQLMFLHLGQDHISELKFHPLIPGVVISTACDGFNFFKTCNI